MDIHTIESTSYIWYRLFLKLHLPVDGVVAEIAPGHEPKIGNALALLGFRGVIYIVEPDPHMAQAILAGYKKILPQASIQIILKCLQDVDVRFDLPRPVDALVASHPFDDMVIASIIEDPLFFNREKESGEVIDPSIQAIYKGISDQAYADAIRDTVQVWQNCIQKIRPKYLIASQYPSRMLTVKKLIKRQESGFVVLNLLKTLYKPCLLQEPMAQSSNEKENPRWWIVARNPTVD